MILKDKKMNTYTRYVSAFKGLNRLPVNSDGELATSSNMVFDKFPVLTVRNGRTQYAEVTGTPRSITPCDGGYAHISGTTLYYNGTATALTALSAGDKSMVYFWGTVYIFPDKKYYNTLDGTSGDIGTGTFPADGSCPDMDYVCVHNNRIWGVKGNYIYASALGYAMGAANAAGVQGWVPGYDDMGNPNENGAYYVSVGSPGSFKGIASWDDKIVALKEHCHHEISGSYPSNFAASTVSKVGTVNNNTIQEVAGRLIYVSDTGVQSYSGSFENNISRPLNEEWETATIYSAGTDGIRYWLSGLFGGVVKTYVYNSQVELWTEETGFKAVQFMLNDGAVYALTEDSDNGKIWKLNDAGSTESVEWSFSFSDYIDEVFSQTQIPKMILRLKGSRGAGVKIEMKVDGSEWEEVRYITLNGASLEMAKFNIRRGAEHIFRISGTGDIEIYGYMMKIQDGGEEIV